MAAPIVPRSLVNPVGQTARINKTLDAIISAVDGIEVWFLARFKEIPVNVEVVNSFYVNKNRYEYQISIPDLERLILELQQQFDNVPSEFVRSQVVQAYENGTSLANINLANISDDYTSHITQILMSDPYQRRAALVGARVFEQMKGFEGESAKDLAFILREAVQDGLAPSDVTEKIVHRFDVSRYRAERIANTEITGALRRGRWDEAQDAQTRLGIKTKLAWLSALSPTTRLWHAQRHGNLYTIQDVREFYAEGGNAIFCKCSQSEVLVDDDGNPLPSANKVLIRLDKQKAQYFGAEQ